MGNFLGAIKGNLSNIFAFKKIRLLEEALQNLKENLQAVQNEQEALIKENEEQKHKIRNFDLVSDALKARPVENQFIKEFASLIENDYKNVFCNIEKGINHAVNLRKLDNILNEMKLIANCPQLHSKNIGAIGGGFSSGKSSFINSFISNSKIKLAEGIKPVTAIPSYVICDEDSQVHGISSRGGKFPISLEMYREISHEFMKFFQFDLKEVILYTTVLAPMERRYFENLCIIDTPGYNPPGSGDTGQDLETARKYIQKANFLIWTIGLDTIGTIPKSDIDFLKGLELFGIDPKKQLYIVANKAQLKTKDDIESILDNIGDTLDDNDLLYAGISAYNSLKRELLDSRKSDIFDFLEKQNRPSGKYAELKGMLFEVFKDYFGEANKDHDEKEKKRKDVKKLILHALASGNINIDDDEASVKLENGLNDLLHYFQPTEQKEERLKRIQNLRDKFLDCLNSFCDDVGIEKTAKIFCKNCGEPVEEGKKLCSKCASIEKVCHNCGKKLKAKSKYCTECAVEV